MAGRIITKDTQEPQGIKVAICIPSHDNCPIGFAYDLARMVGYTGASAVANGEIETLGINLVQGTYIASARQELAEGALAAGVDYILWLDADMRFPKDTMIRLLNANKPMVGINYSTRGVPPSYVAIKAPGEGTEDAERLATTAESTGLEEVIAVGFGAVLMHTSIFKHLHDPRGERGPWFLCGWNAERQRGVGEDVHFCNLVREVGVPIFVDHDLSKECEHVGTFNYRLDHVEALQAAIDEGQ